MFFSHLLPQLKVGNLENFDNFHVHDWVHVLLKRILHLRSECEGPEVGFSVFAEA